MAAASRGFESSSYFDPSLSNEASNVSRGNSASSFSRIPLYEDDALGHSPLRDEETPASPNSQWTSNSTSALAHQPEQVGSASTIRASSTVSTVPHTAYTSRRSQTPFLRGDEGRHVICAVSEARGITPSVGVAFVNIATGEVILSQISDSQFYVKTLHKLNMLEPSHILMVPSACAPNPSSYLYYMIEQHVASAKIVPWHRKFWSESAGLDYISEYALQGDAEAIQVAIQGNFFTTCAFSAVMKHLEVELSLNIVSHTMRIRYEPSDHTMMIDVSAIQSLELVQNLRNSRSKDSLYGLLNQTITPMGARKLKSDILQPTTLVEDVLKWRYEAVAELTSSEDMFIGLVIIPRRPSTEASEFALNQVIMIKAFLASVPNIYQALGPAQCHLLVKIRDLCRPEMTQQVQDLISEAINADVTLMKSPLEMRNARMFAVKSGYNGLLDVARQTYKECTEDVHRYVADLNNAKLKYDTTRRYWLQLKAADFQNRAIPDVLVNRVIKKGHIECLTLQMKKFDFRIADSVTEAMGMGDQVVQEMLDSIRTQIEPMFRVCDAIALLDMLASFAQIAILRDYVRPVISDTLGLRAARHPILDKNLNDEFVPNDVFSKEEYRFQIITGCNMSGKSTYIPEVLGNRFGVINLHLATSTSMTPHETPKMTMLYTLSSGRVLDEHYGITLAKAMGFPDDFLEEAERVSRSLKQQREANRQSPEVHRRISRQNLILNLHEQLKQAYASQLDEEALSLHLEKLQEEFIARIEAIEGDSDTESEPQTLSPIQSATSEPLMFEDAPATKQEEFRMVDLSEDVNDTETNDMPASPLWSDIFESDEVDESSRMMDVDG
ncbi:DNA mismatch repair protein MutS [Verticillium dahliae]|nr:DNA mismatch repair protein MutS [Verticillium dahliae]